MLIDQLAKVLASDFMARKTRAGVKDSQAYACVHKREAQLGVQQAVTNF